MLLFIIFILFLILFFLGGSLNMKKHLYLLSAFVLFVAQFAASTPSQIGHFQAEVPEKLKK